MDQEEFAEDSLYSLQCLQGQMSRANVLFLFWNSLRDPAFLFGLLEAPIFQLLVADSLFGAYKVICP